MSIGSLVANLGLNASGFVSGLQSAKSIASGSMASVGNSMSGMVNKVKSGFGSVMSLPGKFISAAKGMIGPLGLVAGAIAATFAVGAIVNGARDALKAQKMVDAAVAQNGAAAGISSAQIGDIAGGLQSRTNFEGDAAAAAAAGLLKFNNVQGETFGKTMTLAADLAASLDTELGPQVEFLGKALNDPVKGLKALRSAGVVLDDVKKEQIQRLSAEGDIAGAQAILLQELESRVGGTAEALRDPLIVASNYLGDIAELAGFVILPSINLIAEAFIGVLAPIAENTSLAEEWGATLGQITSDYIVPMINWLMGGIDMAVQFGNGLAFAVRHGSALAQIAIIDLLLKVFELIPGSEGVAASLIASLVGAWEAIKQGAKASIDWITGGFKELMQAGSALASGIAAMWDAIWNGDDPITAAQNGFAKFTDELAKQQDVKVGVDPLTAMRESYNSTYKSVQDGFKKDGGLAGSLNKRKDELLKGIGDKEIEFKAKLNIPEDKLPKLPLSPVDENQTAALAKKKKDQDQAIENKSNKSLLATSREGANEILRALSGNAQQRIQERQEQHLQSIEQNSRESANANQRLANKIDQGLTMVMVEEE